MTLNQFKSLEKQLKYIFILQEGIELVERVNGIYHYTLYSMGDFYVEVISNLINDSEMKIAAFSKERRLQPYLLAIDITFLVE